MTTGNAQQTPPTGVNMDTTGASGGGAGNAQPAPTGTGQPATGSQGQGGGSGGSDDKPWFSALSDKDNQTLAEKKGWKGVDDAIKSYRELETAFSSRGVGGEAPKALDDYKFDLPKDLPEDAYNKQFADWFKNISFKNKVSPDLAKVYHDEFVNFAKSATAAQAEAHAAQMTERVVKAAEELKKAWGQEDTPQFTQSLEMAKRAIRHLDPDLGKALKESGVVAEDGTVLNATIFRALATAGSKLYSEDTLYGAPAPGVNPFDPKTTDMQAQAALIKNDPAKAETMIRAAGPQAVEMFAHFLAKRRK